jgi:hypothetical protein
MKLRPLLEGMWVIKNIDGKEKRFKDDRSEAAIAWAQSRSPKTKSELKKELQALRPKKPPLDEIYDKVSNAIGDSFPDGDPIDYFGNWLRKNELTMDDVDRAFKKREKRTYYQYLGDMWEDIARSAFIDAHKAYHKYGREPEEHSNFWHMGKNGPELNDNHWLTRDEQTKARKGMADRY